MVNKKMSLWFTWNRKSTSNLA